MELEDVKKQLDRVWYLVARSDSVDVAEASYLIVELQERSFVKQVAVRPGKATINYAMPTPDDSPNRGSGRRIDRPERASYELSLTWWS